MQQKRQKLGRKFALEETRGDKGDLVLIARASIIQEKSNYWFQLCDTVS